MSIIPVQERWTVYVKGLTGERHSVAIEKVTKLNLYVYLECLDIMHVARAS